MGLAVVIDFCLAEPSELKVVDGGEVLGSVVDPPGPVFWCKANSFVKNAQGHEIFSTGPTSVVPSLFCPCCCADVIPVFDTTGRQAATITRPPLTCCEILTKTNRFVVDFGTVNEPTKRKLLFAAGIAHDLNYWEVK